MAADLIETILEQMQTLATLVENRPDRALRLQEARATSFKQRIESLAGALSDGDAVLLSDAADAALGAHADVVLRAIDTALTVVTSNQISHTARTSGKCHNLTNLPGFLTANQWDRLVPENSVHTWAQTLVECAIQLGCWQPSEKTLKAMLSMIVDLMVGNGMPFPSVHTQLGVIDQLKDYFPKRAEDVRFASPIRDFPRTAAGLTSTHHANAYRDDDPPEIREMPQLTVILQRLKCRKSALRDVADAHVPPPSRKRLLALCDRSPNYDDNAAHHTDSETFNLGDGRRLVIQGRAQRSRTEPPRTMRGTRTVVEKRITEPADADDEQRDAPSPASTNRNLYALAPLRERMTYTPEQRQAPRSSGSKFLDDVPAGGRVPQKRPQYEPSRNHVAPRPSCVASEVAMYAGDTDGGMSDDGYAFGDHGTPLAQPAAVARGAVNPYVTPDRHSSPPPVTPKPSSSRGQLPLANRPTTAHDDRATELGRQIETEAYASIMRSKAEKGQNEEGGTTNPNRR
jgi:hypothetical protein